MPIHVLVFVDKYPVPRRIIVNIKRKKRIIAEEPLPTGFAVLPHENIHQAHPKSTLYIILCLDNTCKITSNSHAYTTAIPKVITIL